MATKVSQNNAFPVEWDDPADAERSWTFDPMHFPDVMTPLGFDLFCEPFIRGFGLPATDTGPRTGRRSRLVNYYFYRNVERPTGLASETPPSPEETLEQLLPAGERWRGEILPEVLRHIEYYRATDFDGLQDGELASELQKLREMRVRQGQLHTMAMRPWMTAMNLLLDTSKELTAGDELTTLRLVQGYGSKSVDAGHEMWRLSRVAASIPSVREQLLEVTGESAEECLAKLRRAPEAEPFLSALSSYLDEYGWRSDLFEFSTPTWAEDPAIPLSQLRAYLDMDGYDPVQELRRLGEERDRAIAETMESLEPEGRARLQRVLEVARDVVSIQEDHNFYIDQRLTTVPRRLVLSAGRSLVSRGHLEEPGNIFYLYADEVNDALQGKAEGLGDLVASRREEMARWPEVTPPPFIGTGPPPDDDSLRRFRGDRHLGAEQPDTLTGNGASAGVARGPARVLMSLAEADRLKRGDVLVARTTMPAWTPLFAITSALVIETGGVLSHAAVTAREYGVPAVLGVEQATRVIRDGTPLEVDGSQGTVRILG